MLKVCNFTEIKGFMQTKCYIATKACAHLSKLLVVGVEMERVDFIKPLMAVFFVQNAFVH